MDLETENRLAALLMEEARRLRREADKDGVHVYLEKPNVRGRPNSRFLTATVLGVEQANRATEISEMWRAREKERELDAKQMHASKDENTGMHVRNGYLNEDFAATSSSNKRQKSNSLCSKHSCKVSHSGGNVGLHDDEIEEFLHSRAKRGRGSVGCRMDEPGPYLSSTSGYRDEQNASPAKCVGEESKPRILGPKKPHFLKLSDRGIRKEKAKHRKKHRSGGVSGEPKAKYA